MRPFYAVFCCLLIVGLVLPLGSPQAAGPLEQVRRYKFFVNLSGASDACGLSSDAMRSAFAEAVRDGGLEVVQSSSYSLYLRATTLRYERETCITSLDARAVLDTRFIDPRTAGEVQGRVELWANKLLLASDLPEHGVQVNSGARSLGQAFVERWRQSQ